MTTGSGTRRMPYARSTPSCTVLASFTISVGQRQRMHGGQSRSSVFAGFVAFMEACMIDKPCCGCFDARRAIRQGRVESWSVFGKLCRLFFGENRIHEEAATAMAIIVGFVIACLCTLRIMRDGDQFAFFGAAHGFGQVTVGILKHALGGTYVQYRVANIRCRHAFAHFHAQCLGELPVADHAGCAVMQSEGDGQHHVTRRREEVDCGRGRSAVHAGFERTHTVTEMQFLIGELFGLLVFAVPDFHAFDAGCDLLAVCANILHH